MPSDQHNTSTMVDEPPTSRRRGRRRNKGPKPWFVLKLSVAVAAAIIAYAGYVYIGRLCIPMIKLERDSLGSRRLGSESLCLPPPLFVLFHCDFGFAVVALILTVFLICISWAISHFLGCFRRAWNDDDLGIYQGAYSVVRPRTTLSTPSPPMLSAYTYM